MEKKMRIVLMAMVLLVISANMEGVKSDAADCYDGCSTACIGVWPGAIASARLGAVQQDSFVCLFLLLLIRDLKKPMGVQSEEFQRSSCVFAELRHHQ
ncbi:hypothetical protein ACJIZ3_015716 [Penstemon smallii]|uniref:Uncharacterized protein n=1 Tax=Penstemon smallii TaxID=265156 RepID=A0ABD3RNH4_9LAMI